MTFSKSPIVMFMMLTVAVCLGCGSEEPDDNDSDTSPGTNDSDTNSDAGDDTDSDTVDVSNDYFPMEVGAYWEYEEKTSTGSNFLTYTVTKKESMDFGGTTGTREVFFVENTFDALNEKRIQFIEDDGIRAVRHGHEVYDITETLTKTRFYVPGFLRFDRNRVTPGETWQETVTRTTDTLDGSAVVTVDITYDFEVISVGEPMTIDIGTFNCIVIKRQDQVDYENKYYWYAPGVGKIRELTSSGDKEEVLVNSSYLDN